MVTKHPTIAEPAPIAKIGRAMLFTLVTLPLGAVAMAVLVAGWATTLSLSFTPLVIPLLIGFAWTVRWLAGFEAITARRLLDAPVYVPAAPPAVHGFWRQGARVVTDRGFWRQQLYLLSRFTIGWTLAIAHIAWLAGAAFYLTSPIHYRWIPDNGRHGINFGIWHADTLAKTLPVAVLGVLGLSVGLAMVRPLATLFRRVAVALLPNTMNEIEHGTSSAPTSSRTGVDRVAVAALRGRTPQLVIHAAITVGVGTLLAIIWLATTRSYFWPIWPILPLALILAIHWWVTRVLADPARWSPRWTAALAIHRGVSIAIWLFLVAIWAISSRGYFWPIWPALGLVLPVGIHWFALLVRRVDTLEQRRAGAVQVQASDLRRIERDLHDGAQARLVALGMNLGLAEQKLATDPDGARALVAEARQGVGDALTELRDLVRGIRPPVLADRGLEAAITALADRSPLRVELTADVKTRPTDTVETAAYFVVAEALTNAAKHAGATRVDVRVQRRATMLIVEVVDDGRGNADPAGAGLTGLRQRVEALDGTLTITSPVGGPTIVRAELPCGQ